MHAETLVEDRYVQIPLKEWNQIKRVLLNIEPLLTTPKSDWITPERAMEELNCSRRTIDRLRAEGHLKYRTLRGQKGVMLSHKSIMAFQEANSNK